MLKKTNIKKQILFIKFLIEEKEECENICNDAKRQFEESVMQAHHDYNVHDASLDSDSTENNTSRTAQQTDEEYSKETDSDKEGKTASSHKHPDWVKKLYRKIAIATHPDKLQKNTSDTVQKNLLEVYTKSKISLEEKDYAQVVIFASDIGVKIPEKEVSESNVMEKKHESISLEIRSLKQSIYWQWANSSDEQKEQILKDFARSRGWMSKENHRKKSRRGSGKHPGKSISQMKKKKLLKK